MAYSSGQLDSKAARDRVNEALRASDVWRNAIKGMGLNPDGPLNLTKAQQHQLEQILGVPTSDFHIDGAGNINDYHGWKGLPTAGKLAIIAAAALGTAGAAGAFGGGTAGAAALPTSIEGTTAITAVPGAITAAGVPASSFAGAAATTAAAGGAAKGVGSTIRRWLGEISPFEAGLLGFQAVTGTIQSRQDDAERKRRADMERERLDFDKERANRLDALDREKWDSGAPYRAAGQSGLVKLSDFMGRPAADPGAYRGTSVLEGGRSTAGPTTPVSSFAPPSVQPAASAARPVAPETADHSTSPEDVAPVSTSMPVGDRSQLVPMQITPNLVKEVPSEFVDRWLARGATVLA